MRLIGTVTVTSGTQTYITFSSIPQTYTDLLLKFSLRADNAASTVGGYMNFNTGTGDYDSRFILGNGSSVVSQNYSNLGDFYIFQINTNASTSNTFASADISIPNYANTSSYKTVSVDTVSENNATLANQLLGAGVRKGTAAISQINIWTGGQGGFVVGSTASLYGITRGSGGATVA